MNAVSGSSLQEIATIFTEQISRAGGHITSQLVHAGILYIESLLKYRREEVRRSDRFVGGVVLKAQPDDQVTLRPYLFRVVCSNGAIMPIRAIETRYDCSPGDYDGLRLAIANCVDEAVFEKAVDKVRQADKYPVAELEIPKIIDALTLMIQMEPVPLRELSGILRRFKADRDKSRYGLMNAVTSLARDTRDPARKWQLQQLGGAIAEWIIPLRPVLASEARQSAAEFSACLDVLK